MTTKAIPLPENEGFISYMTKHPEEMRGAKIKINRELFNWCSHAALEANSENVLEARKNKRTKEIFIRIPESDKEPETKIVVSKTEGERCFTVIKMETENIDLSRFFDPKIEKTKEIIFEHPHIEKKEAHAAKKDVDLDFDLA